jgi:hypothetical protein
MPKKIKTENTDILPKIPRKRKNAKKEEPVPEVIENTEEHIVLQLPIPSDRVHSILEENKEMLNPLEYCHTIIDPEPYIPSNNFMSHNDAVAHTKKEEPSSFSQNLIETPVEYVENKINNSTNCCYWCCHSIGSKDFGLPIKYDTLHDNFTTFGCFCSLECVAAYNYSYYMGSDRMWEIHSWIQWMAHKMGYDTPIRPAPSRYLLKMFNGNLEINEFRELHKTYLKTYILNMPPLIHIQGQMESINTSYLNQKTTITTTSPNINNSSLSTESQEKVKLSRNKAVVDTRKTLDAKMNLTIKKIQDTAISS